MRTYEEIIDGRRYLYYYDWSIRLWTVLEVDSDGGQLSYEADYFHDKEQMLEQYKFTFKKL
jgi:hypothetical protein